MQALEYIHSNNIKNINLYLFSPSYFNDKSDKFKHKQLQIFQNHQSLYLESFYKNCINNQDIDISPYKNTDNISNLKKLLFFKWDKQILKDTQAQNIKIIVYLGECDKIINNQKSKEFFQNYSKIIEVKNAGHIPTISKNIN